MYIPESNEAAFELLRKEFTQESIEGLINLSSVATIFALSIFWGLLIGQGLNRGWIFKVLRADYISPVKESNNSVTIFMKKVTRFILRFTSSTGRTTVWQDAFYNLGKKSYARVYLKDGRIYVGFPKWYSSDPNQYEICLTPNEDLNMPIYLLRDGEEPYPLKSTGILFTASSEIESIEFGK